jgi:hypothetical protein
LKTQPTIIKYKEINKKASAQKCGRLPFFFS